MAGDRPDDLVDRAYQVGAFAVADPAGAGPAAGVDRRGTIRALGIVQIVLGGLSCLTAAAVFVAIASSPKHMGILPGLAYLIPTVNLLVTGIGSVKVARWARRATLISAGIWLGVMLLVVAAQVPVRGLRMGGGDTAIATEIMLPIWLAVLALPIVLLVVYTRPSVRATFERRAA